MFWSLLGNSAENITMSSMSHWMQIRLHKSQTNPFLIGSFYFCKCSHAASARCPTFPEICYETKFERDEKMERKPWWNSMEFCRFAIFRHRRPIPWFLSSPLSASRGDFFLSTADHLRFRGAHRQRTARNCKSHNFGKDSQLGKWEREGVERDFDVQDYSRIGRIPQYS